jgi:hypothetical protein
MKTQTITQPFTHTFPTSAALPYMLPAAEHVPPHTSVVCGPRAVAETGAPSTGPQGPARGLFASPHITHRLCVNCDEVLAGNPGTVGHPGANVLREGHCPVCEQTAREHLAILFLLNHLRLTFEQIPPRARVLALTRGWIRKSNSHESHFVPAGHLDSDIHASRPQNIKAQRS